MIGILHGKLSEERAASEEVSERASENQVLAFRFDIDALPVTECENMDHSGKAGISVNYVQAICMPADMTDILQWGLEQRRYFAV